MVGGWAEGGEACKGREGGVSGVAWREKAREAAAARYRPFRRPDHDILSLFARCHSMGLPVGQEGETCIYEWAWRLQRRAPGGPGGREGGERVLGAE